VNRKYQKQVTAESRRSNAAETGTSSVASVLLTGFNGQVKHWGHVGVVFPFMEHESPDYGQAAVKNGDAKPPSGWAASRQRRINTVCFIVKSLDKAGESSHRISAC
jgi:hypothetical protein